MFFDWKRRCEMKELPQKHCDCVQGLHLGSITIDLVCVFSLYACYSIQTLESVYRGFIFKIK